MSIIPDNRAFAYLRVSGKGQVGGDGFPRQRETIAQWSLDAGVELLGEYKDDVSGKNELHDRPGLEDLVEACIEHGVGAFVVASADRLARDFLIGEFLLDDLKRKGIRVIAADCGKDLTEVDDDNPTVQMIRRLLGIVAQFNKEMLTRNMRLAKRRIKRETGKACEGQKRFGYHPIEKATHARMLELYKRPRQGPRRHGHKRSRGRNTYQAIADTLNAENRPNRWGNKWSAHRVWDILQQLTTERSRVERSPTERRGRPRKKK